MLYRFIKERVLLRKLFYHLDFISKVNETLNETCYANDVTNNLFQERLRQNLKIQYV